MRTSDKIAQYLLPSIRDIFFIALFFTVIRIGPNLLNTDGDLGHHLTIGRLIVESREIPHTDPFSFRTEGKLATPHEWLMQIAFFAVDGIIGLDGIVVFAAVLIALAFTLVYNESLKRSGSILLALVFSLLTAAASSIHWITRPHLITFVLIAVWVANMEGLWRGEHRRWWLFPIMTLFWANVHGMFIVGIIIWIIYLAGYVSEIILGRKGDLRPGLGHDLILAGSLSLPVTLLTPSGWHIWETIFSLAGSPIITQLTLEYKTANFQEAGYIPFLLFLGLTLIGLAQFRGRLSNPRTFLLAAWILMALYSARNIPLAAIVIAPIAAEVFSVWVENWKGNPLQHFQHTLAKVDEQLKGHIWSVLCVILVTGALVSGVKLDFEQKGNQFDPEIFPVQAVGWLKDNMPEGHMFNDSNWGGYLLYNLWPEQKIFMDGHTHVFGEELTKEYLNVINLTPGWEEILDKYTVEWIIIPTNSPLAQAFRLLPNWKVAYEESTTIIYEKTISNP
jgi:hypothetical protein